MKKYFYILLFLTSCTIRGQRSLVDLTRVHFNHDSHSQALVKIETEKQKQLKILKQEQTQYKQDLIEISKSIEKTKIGITSTENEQELILLQQIDQTLYKITLVQKELIPFLDTFIEEIETFLKNFPLSHITSSCTTNNNAKQLTETIANKQKLIDQLISQKNKIQIEHEKEKKRENNLSPLQKQFNSLQQKLHKLHIKNHDYNISLVALHILKETIDLALLKKQSQFSTSSPSDRNQPNAVYTRLLHCIKDSSFASKIATLAGLVGSGIIFMRKTKKKEQELRQNTNQTSKAQNKTNETKNSIQQEKKQKRAAKKEVPTKIFQENFNQSYDTTPPEIAQIYKQLKIVDSKDKQSDKVLPKGLFLVGSETTFLTKYLAEELKAPFLSIPFELLLKELIENKNPLEPIVQYLQKKEKPAHSKEIIIHIDQIALPPNLPPQEYSLILQKLSTAINQIKCAKKNESRVIIIGSLNNDLAKFTPVIESQQLKVIRIPLPSKEMREKIINKNLKTKLPEQTMDYLIKNTKGTGFSFLQSTMQQLTTLAKEKKTTLSEQDIRETIQTKKTERKKELLETITIPGCSFPEVGVEQYFGEIPRSLLTYINKTETDNFATRKFLLSAPDESGRKYLAQCIAGQCEAPLFEISLQDLMKPGILQRCISEIQKVGQEVQTKMVVIYIKENIELFVEENCPHSAEEDFQKISRDQKKALRRIAEQIEKVKNPADKTLPNILLLCPLEKSKEDLIEAEKKEKESIENFILDKLITPDVFEDIIELPVPEEDQIKKAWKKALEEWGPYKKEIDIDVLAKKSDGMYPGRIRKISHDAKNITVKRGNDKISLEDIFLAGKNQLQNDETEKETINSSELQNFCFTSPNFKGTIPEPISNACLQFKYRNYFERRGVLGPTGLLFFGEPGNGKSILISEIIEMFDCPSLKLDCASYAQKYIGEGAKLLKKDKRALQALQHSYPYASRIFVSVEEGEGLLKKINTNKEHSVGLSAVRTVFLTMMDDFKSQGKERLIIQHLIVQIEKNQMSPKDKENLEKQLKKSKASWQLKKLLKEQSEESKLTPETKKRFTIQLNRRLRAIGPPISFLFSTNFPPSKLDEASIRPGRMDVIAKINLPDEPSRVEILAHHLRSYQLKNGLSLNEFAQKLARKTSGSDLAYIAEVAGFEAAKENAAINNTHLQRASENLKEQQKMRRQ